MKPVTVYISDHKSVRNVHVFTDCGDAITFDRSAIEYKKPEEIKEMTLAADEVRQQTTEYVNAVSAPESFWDEYTSEGVLELMRMVKKGFPLPVDSNKYHVEQIGAVLYVRGE